MKKRLSIGVLASAVGVFALALAAPASGKRAGPSLNAVWANPAKRAQAIKAGEPVYQQHCASCHGADAKGLAAAHTPDLTDGRWLFGGDDIDTFLIRPSDIAFTTLHGIRTSDPRSRNLASMPALGVGHSLEPDEVAAVTEYVLKLGGQPHDEKQLALGKETFEGEGGCYDCHTVQGWGDTATGSADLTRPETYFLQFLPEMILNRKISVI